MALSYYKGHDTFVIYGEETSYGAGATPSASNFIGEVTNFTWNFNNGSIRTQGLGDGRNQKSSMLGEIEVNGTIDFNITDPTFLQYAIGSVGATTYPGTAAAPYEFQEVENIGYSGSTETPTLQLKVDSEGGSNDHSRSFLGVVFNDLTISANAGELLTASVGWQAQTMSKDTSISTYSPRTDKPFVFQSGSLTIDSENVFSVTSFEFSLANNIQTFYALGDRRTQLPVTGPRTYDLSMNIRLAYNDAASTLSGIELMEILFGAKGNNSPSATDPTATSYNLQLDITEGASTGDRVLQIKLDDFYCESWSEPIQLDNGVIEVSVNGFALAGTTSAVTSARAPLIYYQI